MNKGEKNKVTSAIRQVTLATIMVFLLSLFLVGCQTDDYAGEMRRQLENLDTGSYADIITWVEEEFPEFEEKLPSYRFSMRINDTDGNRIGRGDFLYQESRFVEWEFTLEEESLTIVVIYQTLVDYFVAQLMEIEEDAYQEILAWIEMNQDDIQITTTRQDTAGNILRITLLTGDEEFFMTWDFDVIGSNHLEITLTYATLIDMITMQLSELDAYSLTEIEAWIAENEDRERLEIYLVMKDINGNSLRHMELDTGRDFFVRWDYEISSWLNYESLRIILFFETVHRFNVGESFVLGGIQMTFEEDVTGHRIENYWSMNDREPYLLFPVTMKNLRDEEVDWLQFDVEKFGPDGTAIERLHSGREDAPSISFPRMQPGETFRGYISTEYHGEGIYVFEITNRGDWHDPFMIEILVPVYGVEIPEPIDRYNREVEIPDVVYDLPLLTLYNHALAADSFFYSVPYVSSLGSTFLMLETSERIRDPEGVITHDSLRVEWAVHDISEREDFEDAVTDMKWWAEQFQQGDNPHIIVGPIRATEDRRTAMMHTRVMMGPSEGMTSLIVAHVLPNSDEILMFQGRLWTMSDLNLEGERRASIEEFGTITGLDFIGILRDTWESDRP